MLQRKKAKTNIRLNSPETKPARFQKPATPDFIKQRRELLRNKALSEGVKALKAIESFGGEAVLFGSVLKEGEFFENSDIDICLLNPPTFIKGIDFFSIAENAVKNFPVDVSWFEDLKDTVKENVIKEGKSASSLFGGL